MSTHGQIVLERTVSSTGGTCLSIGGEVDLLTADRFERALTDAIGEPATKTGLLVDLSMLEFIDSHGIGLLFGAYRSATERDIPFTVVNAGGVVREVLQIVGVYEVLTAG